MKNTPEDLKYVSTHEWARMDDNNTVTVGITHHAQDLLGDIVYVELPTVGKTLKGGEECGVVESVKAASDIYSPLSGEIIEINEDLARTPGLVNEDPYGSGWIFRLRLQRPEEVDSLLTAENYIKQIGEEVH
jgi:glycine cleavage system H protein